MATAFLALRCRGRAPEDDLHEEDACEIQEKVELGFHTMCWPS
jgi:hypothetical protein